MRPLPRPMLFLLLGAVAAVALFPLVGEPYYIQLVTRILVLGIFAMSLDLLIGFTGLISFGHAAFFGLSGYVLALITPEFEAVSIWYALPICLGATAVAALVIGWWSVRISGMYFIMITLAFGQMLYYFFNDNPDFGGSDGIFVSSRPTVTLGPLTLIDLEDRLVFYYFVLGSLIAAYLFLTMILRSPFGYVIAGVRANEPRMRALGYATRRYKLVSFVIAGTLAGLAGFLEATHGGFMNPAYLGWRESGVVLMIVILGGIGTLYGALIGAFIMVLLQEIVQGMTEHWLLPMGLIVIAIVLFLPNGVAGLLDRLTAKGSPTEEAVGEETETSP